jgi:hypothetical protein
MHFRQKTSLAQSALRVIFSMKQSEPIDKQKARKGKISVSGRRIDGDLYRQHRTVRQASLFKLFGGAAVFAPFAVFVGLLALTGAFLLRKK